MTSINHTAVAGIVAVSASGQPLLTKLIIILALFVSHFFLDAVPHSHFYCFKRLPHKELGAAFELGVGFIVLPWLIWHFSGVNFVWLYSCVLSANLFDFLVDFKIKRFIKLNDRAHYWSKFIGGRATIRWEAAQSVVLLAVLAGVTLHQ